MRIDEDMTSEELERAKETPQDDYLRSMSALAHGLLEKGHEGPARLVYRAMAELGPVRWRYFVGPGRWHLAQEDGRNDD